VTREDLRGDDIFVIHEFLSPAECQALVHSTEERGYEDAPITTAAGFVMRKDIRNNTRVMYDDVELAAHLWNRLEPFAVPSWNFRKPVGLNERFRFYRYTPGQQFAPHYDGCFRRNDRERSEFTFMVYLNDDFSGGETAFFEPEIIQVAPQTGMALLFHHPQLHAGTMVESGTKYVLRSDVMYAGDD
jgi:hypothetical protein